jgi:hypothetical protein
MSDTLACSTTPSIYQILKELPIDIDSYNPASLDLKNLQCAAKVLKDLKDLLLDIHKADSSTSNAQNVASFSDPVTETSNIPEFVIQSAISWCPMVWRSLLVSLDSKSSASPALPSSGEMEPSLVSLKNTLQNSAVSCMSLMIPMLRDNTAVTSTLAHGQSSCLA